MGKPIKGGYQIIKLNTEFDITESTTNITDDEDKEQLIDLYNKSKSGEELKPILLNIKDKSNESTLIKWATINIFEEVVRLIVEPYYGLEIQISIIDSSVSYEYNDYLGE